MGKFMKKHVPALIIWVVIVIASIVTMPDISKLVRENGAIKLPDSVESQQAEKIQKKSNGNKSVRTYIAVFNSDKKITSEQSKKIKNRLDDVKREKDLSVTTVMGPNDNEQTRKQLVAKDKTTQLAQITVKTDQPVTKQVDQLEKKLKIKGMNSYVTGIDAINSDFNTVAERGIKKTEIIAIIFIFIVLVIVFHSPIVPIISLLNVGVAFIISLSIVMNLADKFNFPISNFTQVFMVVVLFGIGTDYNILLYNYFKQFLSEGMSAEEATKASLKHGGRTVLYSGVSVLIGFSVLALAKFSFYQSAVGVAIGVLVLLLVLLTLNLFFMSTLGAKMFWPSKVKNGVKESKLWHGLSKASIAQPVVIIGVLLIASLPGIINGSTHLNFNNADEVPDSYPAKKGYVIIQDHFGKGMSAPATIFIESDKRLDDQAHLAAIDEITNYIQKEPGVKSVNSVTQPGGEKVKQLYIRDQLKTINKGLKESKKGLKQIKSGLDGANQQLTAANISESMSKVQTLADGADQLESGTSQLASGVNQYAMGASQANDGVQTLSGQLPTLSGGISQLNTNSQQLANGMGQLKQGIGTFTQQANQLLSAVGAQNPEKANALKAQINQLQSSVDQLAQGSSQLSGGVSQLNSKVPSLTNGVTQLGNGTSQLAANGGQLASGAQTAADGSTQVDGGVQTLNSQLQGLSSKVTELQTGLKSAEDGLDQLIKGNDQVKGYLEPLANSYVGDTFYIPKDMVTSKEFKPALDAYMSDDRKITQMMMVFKGDPNSEKVSQQLIDLQKDLNSKIKHGELKDVKVAVGGQTSQNNDLRKIANGDFIRTAAIMTIGIGIALMVVTESVLQPMAIITTLVLTYISSLWLARIISKAIIGNSLLSWNTPFFTFIMLVALGVDYSIFLMIHFKDTREVSDLKERMLESAKVIGPVVISAAIILSGTFAALMPSGVTTLIQVALAVIIGLFILVIALPMSMSALISLIEWHNNRMYDKSTVKDK